MAVLWASKAVQSQGNASLCNRSQNTMKEVLAFNRFNRDEQGRIKEGKVFATNHMTKNMALINRLRGV